MDLQLTIEMIKIAKKNGQECCKLPTDELLKWLTDYEKLKIKSAKTLKSRKKEAE